MPQSPIIPFRANEQDRERLEFLKQKLAIKKTAQVLRKGLDELYEAVRRKDK